jgi:hypothetical protein
MFYNKPIIYISFRELLNAININKNDHNTYEIKDIYNVEF